MKVARIAHQAEYLVIFMPCLHMVQHDGIITDTETYQIENMKVFWEAFR